MHIYFFNAKKQPLCIFYAYFKTVYAKFMHIFAQLCNLLCKFYTTSMQTLQLFMQTFMKNSKLSCTFPWQRFYATI